MIYTHHEMNKNNSIQIKALMVVVIQSHILASKNNDMGDMSFGVQCDVYNLLFFL